ncbi:MAG TPA: FHA domain-containing protein, partial [Pirellulaceae bacterium]|nr:FHA domain-containing protein [Pirellulaceae bacterium]
MPFLLIDESSGKTFDLTEYEELLAGRSADAQLPLMDGDCSRRQFRIARRNDGWQVESLSSRVPTWCDDKALVEPVELRDGLRLRVNKHMWRVADRTVAHFGHGEQERATAFGGGDEWRTVWRTNVDSLPSVVPASPGRIALADDLLLGRESPADVKLSHVQVSRRHARLQRQRAAGRDQI